MGKRGRAQRAQQARAAAPGDAAGKQQQAAAPGKAKKRRLQPPGNADSAARTAARPPFPFKPDEADHCETPLGAYQDVACVLDAVAASLGKSRAEIRVYDPYYCDGAVVRHLGALGFSHVYNKCEDFYARVADGSVPEFDVMVTNPPYSGDHMERLLRFARSTDKPWVLLMPNFVYTKPYFSELMGTQRVSFLVRAAKRYDYLPPSWVSKAGSTAVGKGKVATAPFPSFWYCRMPPALLPRLRKHVHVAERKTKEMFEHPLVLCLNSGCLPAEVRGELDTTRKRPNAKTRKRMKQRLQRAREEAERR